MRAATEQERLILGKLGILQPDAQAFAIDLIEGRVLASGFVTSNERTFPVMIVTDGEHVAHVSCDWNGSAALGIDTDQVGRMAVRATVDLLGQEVCESPFKPTPTPTTPAPKKVNGKCKRMNEGELRYVMNLKYVGGAIRFTSGIMIQTTTDHWEFVVKTWYDRYSDYGKPEPIWYFTLREDRDGAWHSGGQGDGGTGDTPAARACARAAGWVS